MQVLLTNDDGITAPGLLGAYRELSGLAGARIAVVAPDRERSASGHGLTMHRPLRAEEVDLPAGAGSGQPGRGWAVSGTPADCVKLALEYFLEKEPELVLSGINRGANLGTDVVYSGTVSAALEAAIYGVPAIAVSVTDFQATSFDLAAGLTRRLAELFLSILGPRGQISASSGQLTEVLASHLPASRRPEAAGSHPGPGFRPGFLLNVNVPNCPREEIKGVRVTRLGQRRYLKSVEARHDPRGRLYFWLAGEIQDIHCEEDTDICAIKEGYISITPLGFDLTESKLLEKLKGVDWPDLLAP